MKKTYLCIGTLSYLLLGCGDLIYLPAGEECAENADANYADDEYSPIQNDNAELADSIQQTSGCNIAYPICNKRADKYYCARCQPGEIYAKWDSGNAECRTCQEMIANADACAGDSLCTQTVERCRAGAELLTVSNDLVTLYFDYEKTLEFTYTRDEKPVDGAELEVTAVNGIAGSANTCVSFDKTTFKTDDNGIARLKLTGTEPYHCDEGKSVTVCLKHNNKICQTFTVRTTDSLREIDANGNLMIDEYEKNADKDLFAGYSPDNRSSFCRQDSDCPDSKFCDSASGYRCAAKCEHDYQCVKEKQGKGKWINFTCRSDGRCAAPFFEVIYKIHEDGKELKLGGHLGEGTATIDWGDGTKQEIPKTTNNDLKHTYAKKGMYNVVITGDYRDWTAGCKMKPQRDESGKIITNSFTPVIDLYDVKQFGDIGLGFVEKIDEGSFCNCLEFDLITAKDIPNPNKLTTMEAMFSGNHIVEGEVTIVNFNQRAVWRWDTSNVTSMKQMFQNNQKFTQDIGAWNMKKVETTSGMFNGALAFNQDVSLWDMSNVKNISNMFSDAFHFNQNLEAWDVSSVTNYTSIFSALAGHYGDLSIKNYCKFRSLFNANLGRDSVSCSTVKQGPICENDRWKTDVEKCMESIHKTEDTMTCSDLSKSGCYK